jgi:hypothetical protein
MNAVGVKLGNGAYSPEQNGGVAYGQYLRSYLFN